MKTIIYKLDRFFLGKWSIAVLDSDRGRWLLKPGTRIISYLKAENANGRHILIQPAHGIQSSFLMADDITWPRIEMQHMGPDRLFKPGRMIVETSPDNHQIWIRSSRPLSLEEKRYWLHRLKSDPGADPNGRWGRCPGFRNRKECHHRSDGTYPLSRLLWVDWKNDASVPAAGAETQPMTTAILSPQPQVGGVCRKDISRSHYNRQDESATDFAYALALARRDLDDEAIKDRILLERKDWKNHHGEKKRKAYLDRTVAKARAIIQNS